MNILASIHLYPPKHNCGGEYYLHNIFKFLISRGHKCRVFLHQGSKNGIDIPYIHEGVEVFSGPEIMKTDSYRWADIILTHLDFTQYTIIMAHEIKKPLVHLIHNDIPYASIEGAISGNYIVYNSEWIANKLNYKWPSIVVHPACDYDYYNVNEDPIDNEYITLINLDENKGGEILRELAKAMPERKFLGVMGSYSSPASVGQFIDQPGNVKVIPNTKDIRPIYKQTRILLMPSRYESWGMTATEAMCNGIPVIACPTPGLKENLSYAGTFIPKRRFLKEDEHGNVIGEEPYKLKPLIAAIKKLDKPDYYKETSDLCRKRAKELSPEKELFQLEQFLINAKQDYRYKANRNEYSRAY